MKCNNPDQKDQSSSESKSSNGVHSDGILFISNIYRHLTHTKEKIIINLKQVAYDFSQVQGTDATQGSIHDSIA